MTWTQFFEAFFEKYILHSLWEHPIDQFSNLEYILMIVAEYEVKFYELEKYTTAILPTNYEWFGVFIHGWDFLFTW